MFKHYFTPHGRTYFNGVEKITTYRCEYCGKVIYNNKLGNEMNRHESVCVNSHSSSKISEDIVKEYDCTTFNKSYRYYFYNFKKILLKKYKKVKMLTKNIFIHIIINLYTIKLILDMCYTHITEDDLQS
jgi:hypothetical protein